MTTYFEKCNLNGLMSKIGGRFVSCDRGVSFYEVDLSEFSMRGCSSPIPMLLVSNWGSDARASLLEKTNRLAAKDRLMLVGAGHEQAALHAWKELPKGAVYLDYNTVRMVTVYEDPISIIHSRIVSQIGIRRLNPIEQPTSIDPTALILREREIAHFRAIDAPIVTMSGPHLFGKSVFANQVLLREEATFVNCEQYLGQPDSDDDFVRFLAQKLRSPADIHTVDDFTTALIDESATLNPVLVLDNSHARNVYCSPTLSHLAKAAAAKPFRIVLIGLSNVFQESKWLRPNCKTERFNLPPLSINQARQLIQKLFSSLEIRITDSECVIGELIAMANGFPGELTALCNLLIRVCVSACRHVIGPLDIHELRRIRAGIALSYHREMRNID